MSRKVFITSAISVDEDLIAVADALPIAPFVWTLLITHFDDWGRGEASPITIKAKVFPMFDIVTRGDIEKAIDLFHEKEMLLRYEVDGKQFIAVHPDKWFKYQTMVRGEKRTSDAESKYPRPAEHEEWWQDAHSHAVAPGSENSSADSRSNSDNHKLARKRTHLHAPARVCIPSPSPSPSPSGEDNPLTPLLGERQDCPDSEQVPDETSKDTERPNQSKSETGGDSAAPRRGCRLPEGWTPPADALDGMQNAEEYKKLNLPLVLEEFRDHFTAATGQNAVKLDWVAAWRNWVRRTDPVRFRLPELRTTPPSFPSQQVDPKAETPEEKASAYHRVLMTKYGEYRDMTAAERAAHRRKKLVEFPNAEELAQKQLDQWAAQSAAQVAA